MVYPPFLLEILLLKMGNVLLTEVISNEENKMIWHIVRKNMTVMNYINLVEEIDKAHGKEWDTPKIQDNWSR